jgi:hypothetical protein
MDIARLFSSRAQTVQESQIRKVFEGARDIPNPINLSIGQPDFPVPEPIKQATIRAIQADQNGYANNRGIDPLLHRIVAHLKDDVGWDVSPTPKGQAGQPVFSLRRALQAPSCARRSRCWILAMRSSSPIPTSSSIRALRS